MAWFKQEGDTLEWAAFQDDVLLFRWPAAKLKKGTRLLLRPGQKAAFFANGRVEGVWEEPGCFDLDAALARHLVSGKSRGESPAGLRAEVYFVNSRLLLPWGIPRRVLIPTPEMPSGVPLGCNGNLIVEVRDCRALLELAAGMEAPDALRMISGRVMDRLPTAVAECILGQERTVPIRTLLDLQTDSRPLGQKLATALDRELTAFGLGVRALNILSLNYPGGVQALAQRAAGERDPAGKRFCPGCRKVMGSKFCPDCGSATV